MYCHISSETWEYIESIGYWGWHWEKGEIVLSHILLIYHIPFLKITKFIIHEISGLTNAFAKGVKMNGGSVFEDCPVSKINLNTSRVKITIVHVFPYRKLIFFPMSLGCEKCLCWQPSGMKVMKMQSVLKYVRVTQFSQISLTFSLHARSQNHKIGPN